MIVFMIAYVAVLIGIAVYSSRRVSSGEDFLLAGRRMGPWMTAFAYGTSYFSAVVFVGYAGTVGWDFGVSATWIGLGNAILGSLCAWLLLARQLAPKLGGCFKKADDHYTMQDEDLTVPRRIEFCTGSFSGVRTSTFKAVGGFDESYFMYVEDADLTQKMRTRGKAYLVPQYTAIHAWHRAAHRSLKPFLWQLRSLLRYAGVTLAALIALRRLLRI